MGVRSIAAAGAGVCAALLALPAPAAAHNRLLTASPGSGAVVADAPRVVTLDFAEQVNPRFANVAVTDEQGRPLNGGPPRTAGADVTQPVTIPSRGPVTVAYRVVSRDGHPVQGSYTFHVGTVPPRAAPAATATEPDRSGLLTVAGVTAAVLAAGALAFWPTRRRVKRPGGADEVDA